MTLVKVWQDICCHTFQGQKSFIAQQLIQGEVLQMSEKSCKFVCYLTHAWGVTND